MCCVGSCMAVIKNTTDDDHCARDLAMPSGISAMTHGVPFKYVLDT